MSRKNNYLTSDQINIIKNILDKIELSIPANELSSVKIGKRYRSVFLNCLVYLLENDCLIEKNIALLVIKSEKNNLEMMLKLAVLKRLSDKNILNQNNFDNIFNHPIIVDKDTWSRHFLWRNLFRFLVRNDSLMTQANLDKILLHSDFKNLMQVLSVFLLTGDDLYEVFTQALLDNITSQSNLARFFYLLGYLPNSVWQSGGESLTSVIDKLLQCNKKLGNTELTIDGRPQLDYKIINEKNLQVNILDKCIAATTPQEAAIIFNRDQPVPKPFNPDDYYGLNNLSTESYINETIHDTNLNETIKDPHLRIERSLPMEFRKTKETVSFSNSVNDSFLLGSYILSYFFKPMNFRPLIQNTSSFSDHNQKLDEIEQKLFTGIRQFQRN